MRKRFALSKIETPEILTYGSLERWSIIITILEIILRKMKAGRKPPILVKTIEVDDFGFHVNSIRNTMDVLKEAKVFEPYEKEVDEYQITLTPNGIKLLQNDLNKWSIVLQRKSVDKLRIQSLEIFREILDEINTFL